MPRGYKPHDNWPSLSGPHGERGRALIPYDLLPGNPLLRSLYRLEGEDEPMAQTGPEMLARIKGYFKDLIVDETPQAINDNEDPEDEDYVDYKITFRLKSRSLSLDTQRLLVSFPNGTIWKTTSCHLARYRKRSGIRIGMFAVERYKSGTRLVLGTGPRR